MYGIIEIIKNNQKEKDLLYNQKLLSSWNSFNLEDN